MKTSPQLALIVEKTRDLCRREGEEPETIATLLWLLVASEDCRRALEAASPTAEDLERTMRPAELELEDPPATRAHHREGP